MKRRVQGKMKPRVSRMATMPTDALERALAAAEERVVSGNDPEGIYASEASTLQGELERRLAMQRGGVGMRDVQIGQPEHPAEAVGYKIGYPLGVLAAKAVNFWNRRPGVVIALGIGTLGGIIYLISRYWRKGKR